MIQNMYMYNNNHTDTSGLKCLVLDDQCLPCFLPCKRYEWVMALEIGPCLSFISLCVLFPQIIPSLKFIAPPLVYFSPYVPWWEYLKKWPPKNDCSLPPHPCGIDSSQENTVLLYKADQPYHAELETRGGTLLKSG